MIILLDTSTAECRLTIIEGEGQSQHTWQADRLLAKGLLGYIRDVLAQYGGSFTDIEGIGVYSGPGSFTGLRIGITVANTLAHELGIPIVGSSGDDWRNDALGRLGRRESDKIVLPKYGSEANITIPRK